ncbi:hypothetical protein HK101_011423 [Irineochytrium annulatum]|nr:hypothetical protein HK101_011423 [Irineochytrium annulatum]
MSFVGEPIHSAPLTFSLPVKAGLQERLQNVHRPLPLTAADPPPPVWKSTGAGFLDCLVACRETQRISRERLRLLEEIREQERAGATDEMRMMMVKKRKAVQRELWTRPDEGDREGEGEGGGRDGADDGRNDGRKKRKGGRPPRARPPQAAREEKKRLTEEKNKAEREQKQKGGTPMREKLERKAKVIASRRAKGFDAVLEPEEGEEPPLGNANKLAPPGPPIKEGVPFIL